MCEVPTPEHHPPRCVASKKKGGKGLPGSYVLPPTSEREVWSEFTDENITTRFRQISANIVVQSCKIIKQEICQYPSYQMQATTKGEKIEKKNVPPKQIL